MNMCAVCGNPPVLRRKRIGTRGEKHHPTTGGRRTCCPALRVMF